MSGNGATTRAEWVVPRRKLTAPANSSKGISKNRENKQQGVASIFKQPYHDYDSSLATATSSSSIIIAHTYTSNNLNHQRLTQSEYIHSSDSSKTIEEKNQIDEAICRTICVIVEQYLRELREHQKQINLARSKLVRETHQTIESGTFIAHNDVSRLRVRDEQIRAIETIKQLTNYLKELSAIKRDESDKPDSATERIHDKLSDLRNDIIHTLNDFVLANSDIDVPIVDLDDPTSAGRDYDLCIEAHRSNRDIAEIEISNQQAGDTGPDQASSGEKKNGVYENSKRVDQQLVRRPLASRNVNVVKPLEESRDDQRRLEVSHGEDKYKLLAIEDDYQLIELDKRKREIQKLEKDTIELRNLFADFYNLVKMQGEQVNTIEENLVIAAHQIGEGRHHLQQRSLRGLTVLLSMTGCVTGAMIGGPIGLFVGGKVGGVAIICATSLLGFLSCLGAQKCIEPRG